jgi:hypothetical protein
MAVSIANPPDMNRFLREKQEVQTIKNIAKDIQAADTLKQIRQHMAKLSQHMERAPVEFTEGNDILKMEFEKDVSAALDKLLRTISSYRDMFVGSSLLEGTTSFLKAKIAQRMSIPGESWSKQMIDDIVSILPNIPIGMMQQNPNFLATVAKLPNSHVLRMGAGIWFAIHHLTAAITTEQEQEFACKVIQRYQEFFPCSLCKEHFGKYLENPDTSPMELKFAMKTISKDDKGNDIVVPGLFVWSMVFHNAVNAFRVDHLNNERLHFDLETAYRQYFVDKEPACTSSCH